MRSFIRIICLNFKYLIVKSLIVFLAYFPLRNYVIYLAGFTVGLFLTIFDKKRNRRLKRCFSATGVGENLFLSIFKYNVTHVESAVFEFVVLERDSLFGKYFDVSALELLNTAHRAQKGLLIAGVHLRPYFHEKILDYMGFHAVVLIGVKEYRKRIELISHVMPVLLPCRYKVNQRIKAAPWRYGFVKNLSEMMPSLMLPDFPNDSNGVKFKFFNIEMPFNPVLFKAALKYDIPVFYIYLVPLDKLRYRVMVVEAESFKTSCDGVKNYLTFVEREVKKYPQRWGNFLFLGHWLRKRDRADVLHATHGGEDDE